MGELLELVSFIKEGGIASMLVVIVAVMGTAIAIERWVAVQFRYSVNSRAFMAKLKKYILSDNIDRAISLCNSRSQALLPKVLKSGLTRAKDSTADIQNAIDEATLEAIPKLEARALYLPTLANLATLIGLFGTILGLIMAFRSAGDGVDAVQRQMFLQKAIAIAMHTTCLGIAVAIPMLFVHAVLQSRINQIISDIDQYSVKLINLLSAAQKMGRPNAQVDDEGAQQAND
ncbi:MAG: MotA/TolQ/ExbB proton channel family protein [Deltaproteobacteria bacterium]|nr:MotA/TolQ/ExbB proton channel family protein [Deltaproteobacteria bacterium]